MKKRLKHKVLQRRRRNNRENSLDYIGTGSTLLNLACTDHPNRGFKKGHYYMLVGDSRSGKTFLSLTCLAEAASNKGFDNHRFIYDDVEQGALMDFRRFFGNAMADRIEPPALGEDNNPQYSNTIEQFYDHLDDAVKQDQPFIYILDSHDALDSTPAQDKFEEQKKARRSGKEAAGSYGDGKAKINSGSLRRFILPLQHMGSILLIINQTRDKLATFGPARGKTRSGGWALQFYATLELWSKVANPIIKTVRGKKRAQGTFVNVRVKKNRVTGKDREVRIPIFNSYGIDDIGSCIDFLVDEKHWKVNSGVINATDLELKGYRDVLANKIVEHELEKDVKALVAHIWRDIEDALEIKRKPRYS